MLANGAGSREPEGGVQEQAPSGRLQQVVGAVHHTGCRHGCIAPSVAFTCLAQAGLSCYKLVSVFEQNALTEATWPLQDSPRASRGRDHSPDSPSSSSQRGSLGRSRDADWERRARQRSRSHHRTTDSYLDPR